MKLINKILTIASGFALSIGAISFAASIPMKAADAKVSDTDTVSKTAMTSVTSGDIVVFGTTAGYAKNIATTWVEVSTTKTDWLKFEVTTDTGGFYLKETESENYFYVKSQKEMSLSSSSKTLFSLVDSALTCDIGTFKANTANMRAYGPTSMPTAPVANLFQVSSATVTGIAVKEGPTKTSYKEGEKFDSTGLVLTVTYSDLTTKDVSEDYTWDLTDGLSSTDTKVTVTYCGKTVDIDITVASLTSLFKEGTLVKNTYNAGEEFDPTGLTIYANYSVGDPVDVTSEVSWGELVKGATSVTGTYGSKTITVEGLTVNASAAYTLVTSASSLKAGDQLLFVFDKKIKDKQVTAIAGAFVSGTKTYLSSVTSEIKDGMITPTESMNIITLGGEAGAWTFTTSEGLLGSSEAKSVNVSGQGTTTWTIAIETSGLTTIKTADTNKNWLLYNIGSPRFLTYAGTTSGQIEQFYLYSKASGTVEDTITGITVSPNEKQTLAKNATLKASAVVEGGEDADKTVNWTASPAGVVSFNKTTSDSSEEITITAVAGGIATITATAAGDDSYSTSFDVNVEDPAVATEVIINEGKDAVGVCYIANQLTLSAEVLPSIASDKTVTWSTSDETIATVTNEGVVTSVKPGKAVITATSNLTNTVKDTIDFYSFSQKGTKETCPLCPTDLAMAIEGNVWPEDVNETAASEFTGMVWFKGIVSSEVTQKSGKYSFTLVDAYGTTINVEKMISESAIAKGNTIKAIGGYDCFTKDTGEYYVTGAEAQSVEDITVEITAISIPETASVKAGNTVKLNAALAPSYTTQTGITWISSDEDIATVTDGVVTGVSVGEVTITAKSSSKPSVLDTCTVTVTPASQIAGTYTLTSNTTSYVAPTSVAYTNVASFLTGYDNDVFSTSYVDGIAFGCAPETSAIYFSDAGGDISFNLNDLEARYVFAEVILEGARSKHYDADITIGSGNQCFTLGNTPTDVYFAPNSDFFQISTRGETVYVDAITLVVVEKTDVEGLAEAYADYFLGRTYVDCSKLNVSNETWLSVSDAFNTLTNVSEDAALSLMYAEASESGTKVEQAAARYDYIMAKYTSLDNFMGRTVVSPRNTVNAEIQTSIMVVVTIISVIAISSLTLFLILKKKKVN